jgi:diguanylate cyclase (GGDEF)-like protein
MLRIVGLLHSPAGLSWQVQREVPQDKTVGLTIIFPFHGAPTAREARLRVEKELLAATEVNWFRLRGKTWIVDLKKLAEGFNIEHEWLNRAVTISPEYDVTPDTFKKTEMRGTLSVVFERDHMGQHEMAWGEYPEDELDVLVSIRDRRSLNRDVKWLFDDATDNRTSTVAMFDIDHFKIVNDTHGHAGGDAVLIRVAEVIRDITGRRGTAYRYGGEELTVLLPDFATDDSFAVVERIREAVAAQVWPEYQGLKVTISAGIAEGSGGAESANILKLADAALYAAKKAGRNRVERALEHSDAGGNG